MSEEEWTAVIQAYRNGLTADLVQMQHQVGGNWGVLWSIPPQSPDAMERAARQIARCRAARIRHVRRAVLARPFREALMVVIVTEAPPAIQAIRCVNSACACLLDDLLIDDGLRALLDAADR